MQLLENIDVDDHGRAVDFYCTIVELRIGRRGVENVELTAGSRIRLKKPGVPLRSISAMASASSSSSAGAMTR